ncbi:MAG TPA: sulfotransferase [Arenicellales bacterium]|nr:sulfotransferase [Arenicellales bacterium]
MARRPANPSWNHPLFGADPRTLLEAVAANRPLGGRARLMAAVMLLASLLRGPATLCERGLTAARLRRLPPPRQPVFILGHWRSGTTHLFNLMSRDPRFCWADPFTTGLPWDYRLLGRLARPLIKRALPANRFVDGVAVTPDSPQEDEIALASMQGLSWYHAIYFPRRFETHWRQGVFLDGVDERRIRRWRRRFEYYHRKLLAADPDRTLLVKNPAYTGRVALLRRIWPEARFIHIRRNPYTVFASTRRFWRTLLRRYALQDFDDELAEGLMAETYPRMINRLYEDVADLGGERFVELSFEALERDPLGELARIYRSLGLAGYDESRDRFERYLESVRDYEKNRHEITRETVDKVDRHWGELARRWSYQPPGTEGDVDD